VSVLLSTKKTAVVAQWIVQTANQYLWNYGVLGFRVYGFVWNYYGFRV
jgi:hypothetical protein